MLSSAFNGLKLVKTLLNNNVIFFLAGDRRTGTQAPTRKEYSNKLCTKGSWNIAKCRVHRVQGVLQKGWRENWRRSTQNFYDYIINFPGAIKPAEQKIGTFGPQTEKAGYRGGRIKMAQQMSQGSRIKVHALKGSSEGSNAENGLLSAKMREVRGWSLKTFFIL